MYNPITNNITVIIELSNTDKKKLNFLFHTKNEPMNIPMMPQRVINNIRTLPYYLIAVESSILIHFPEF